MLTAGAAWAPAARGPAGLVTLQGAPSAMKPKALPVGEGSTAVGFTKLGDRYCVMSEKGACRRRRRR